MGERVKEERRAAAAVIENSDAVSVAPFSFRPFPSPYVHRDRPTDRPTDQFFFHSNCAPIVWSPWGSQSVPSSLRSVSPSPLHHSARASATGSISIDLKFSKPISCTRLQFATERKGERAAEGERESKVQLVLPSPMRQSRLHRRRPRRRR